MRLHSKNSEFNDIQNANYWVLMPTDDVANGI